MLLFFKAFITSSIKRTLDLKSRNYIDVTCSWKCNSSKLILVSLSLLSLLREAASNFTTIVKSYIYSIVNIFPLS